MISNSLVSGEQMHELVWSDSDILHADPPPSVVDLLTTTSSVSTPPLDPLVSPPHVPFSMKFDMPVNSGLVIPEILTAPAHGEFPEEIRTEREIGASGGDLTFE